MSLTSGINPVAIADAITPQPQQANTAKQSDGKDFAKVLDKAAKKESDDSVPVKKVEAAGDKKAEKAADETSADTAAAAVEAAIVNATLAANAAITEVAIPVVPVAIPVAPETPVVAPEAAVIEGITVIAPATPVTTPEVAAPVVAPVVAPVSAAPVAAPAPVETEAPVAATPAPLPADTDVPVAATPVTDGEVPASNVVATPVDAETVVAVATDQLVDALSTKVAVAAATGEIIADKPVTPAVANANEAARTVLEALAPSKSQDAAPVNAPATTGADATDIPAPVRQLVHLVAPLRHNGDGDYKLLLQLHPEHLGRVEVAVSLNQGQISMQLAADNPNSRQMLRDSMNELRESLLEAGLDAGSLDVGQQSTGQQTNNAESGRNGQVGHGVTDADEEQFLSRLTPSIDAATQNKMATDGPLDVHV